MKAELLSAVVGDNCAEVVEHGSGGSRGVFLSGDRLAVWVERDSRRKILLDAILDKRRAELIRDALGRLNNNAPRFGQLFDVLTNAVRLHRRARSLLRRELRCPGP